MFNLFKSKSFIEKKLLEANVKLGKKEIYSILNIGEYHFKLLDEYFETNYDKNIGLVKFVADFNEFKNNHFALYSRLAHYNLNLRGRDNLNIAKGCFESALFSVENIKDPRVIAILPYIIGINYYFNNYQETNLKLLSIARTTYNSYYELYPDRGKVWLHYFKWTVMLELMYYIKLQDIDKVNSLCKELAMLHNIKSNRIKEIADYLLDEYNSTYDWFYGVTQTMFKTSTNSIKEI